MKFLLVNFRSKKRGLNRCFVFLLTLTVAHLSKEKLLFCRKAIYEQRLQHAKRNARGRRRKRLYININKNVISASSFKSQRHGLENQIKEFGVLVLFSLLPYCYLFSWEFNFAK